MPEEYRPQNKSASHQTKRAGLLGSNLQNSYAYGINTSGQVVGSSYTVGNAAIHAFRTAANGPIVLGAGGSDLGSLGGTQSGAFGINTFGQVVGYSQTTGNAASHAFFTDVSGAMVDLNALIDPASGWVLTEARGINDSGQIAGTGIAPNGQTHAFLLTRVSKTYAIVFGSNAPSNGVEGAVRGDLDADHVAAKLAPWAQVQEKKYFYSLDPNTMATDIKNAIAAITPKPGDRLIFYYSGHGSGGSILGVPQENALNPVAGGAFNDDALTAALADPKLAGVKKMVILDACHAGGIWNNKFAGDSGLAKLSDVSLIAAASDDTLAMADPNDGTGYLTNALLSALSPGASYNSILAAGYAALGNEDVTGYFKDDGFGNGTQVPIGFFSSDFDPNARFDGVPGVPEPASLSLFGAACAALLRRRIQKRGRLGLSRDN